MWASARLPDGMRRADGREPRILRVRRADRRSRRGPGSGGPDPARYERLGAEVALRVHLGAYFVGDAAKAAGALEHGLPLGERNVELAAWVVELPPVEELTVGGEPPLRLRLLQQVGRATGAEEGDGLDV